MRIGRSATLDRDQRLVQAIRQRATGTIADREVAVMIGDLTDRRHDRGGAAGERLDQLAAFGIVAPLVDRIGLLMHGHAGIARQRQDRIAGDAR